MLYKTLKYIREGFAKKEIRKKRNEKKKTETYFQIVSLLYFDYLITINV